MRRSIIPVLLVVLLLVPGCVPVTVLPAPTRFYALNLPTTIPPADSDGQPVTGVFRSLRLLLDDLPLAHSHTVVGDTEQGQQLEAGHTLGMSFTAESSFQGIAVSLSRIGPGPTRARLTLRSGGRQGSVIAARDLADIPQRAWAEMRTPSEQPAGLYHVELSGVSRTGVRWRGYDLGSDSNLWQGYQQSGVPFKLPQSLAGIPSYDSSSLSIRVNTQAERIYILGGRSTYDYGIGQWGDYEARADASDRQFVGDKIGELEVVYADGTSDHVPLILGFNQWWWKPWGDKTSGGPFLEPLSTTPRPLIASLQVYSLENSPLAPSFWVYRPQKKTIAHLRLIDNAELQGFPLVAAITLEARQGGPNALVLPDPPTDSRLSDWLLEHTITPEMLANASYEPALAKLRSALYTTAADVPDNAPLDAVPGRRGPRLLFEGTATARVLSNVYEHSLNDLLSKLDGNGAFHASTSGSANYGLYGGIGTWRNSVGYFYDQAWSRDMGRTLLELIRLGFVDEAEAGLRAAAARLYDLPNGYPTISRNGQRVPAHWGTILGQPNTHDIDGMGDDNQENDGHGLILLAYVRAWQARGRTPAWIEGFWPVVRDASEWYCYQLENPDFSRATGVLYTEGEAAGDGGYDVYSNAIAVEALRGTADMARSRGDTSLAQRWDACANTISQGMQQQLTERDTRYGLTWQSTSLAWAYGHESLAPALISADRQGYVLSAGSTLSITRQTYLRQLALPSGLRSGRILGYGQSFLTQAALLLDDLPSASAALDAMAQLIYSANGEPYLPPEGVALHPSGAYWYRTGDLGNAMQEAEVIKTLALLAGMDDLGGQGLAIVPRAPATWTTVSVSDYPVTVSGQRLTVDYTLTRETRRLNMTISATQPIPALSVRLGPVPSGASPHATVNGVAQNAETVTSGGSNWVWLRDLGGRQGLSIDVEW